MDLVFFMIAIVVYIIPSIIAWMRKKRELPAIIALKHFWWANHGHRMGWSVGMGALA